LSSAETGEDAPVNPLVAHLRLVLAPAERDHGAILKLKGRQFAQLCLRPRQVAHDEAAPLSPNSSICVSNELGGRCGIFHGFENQLEISRSIMTDLGYVAGILWRLRDALWVELQK
jgi:hypothetical protein